MKFNTAILYDIENLIGGYGKNDMLTNLSLKDIFDKIQEKEIGKIAIQRAYANWSNPKLNILRGDVNELGIEPVQMFGFGKGSQKNASDIQLAIDAIDIAFTRDVIEIFIIVSGDGGFSTLAKKLHEYGKMVIGCAYKRTTNKVFKAVCDDFIWIEEPKEESLTERKKLDIKRINNPIVAEFAKKYKSLDKSNKKEVINIAKEIIRYLAKNRSKITAIKGRGLNISNFSELLDYRLKDFNYFNLGFVKFTDFIRYVTYQTDIKLVYKEPSEYRLLMVNCHINNYNDTEYITELKDLHSVENYQQLLGKGTPTFRQFNLDTIYHVSNYFAENKLNYQDLLLGDIVESLDDIFEMEQSEIKSSIMALISADCFLRQPLESKLSEQKLSFIPQSAEQAIDMVEQAMKNKLQDILDDFDEEVFEKVFYA